MSSSSRKSVATAVAVNWAAVGRRLRELRGFEMTQQEFSRRIGISQNYLSTMERGKVEIGAEILLKIGCEFGKSIEWLLTGDDKATTRKNP
jgi:transcriptional regulator with XRE-family HTH domain